MFKFGIGEDVKIKVYNRIHGGDIVLRTLTEDKNTKRITYTVDFPQGIGLGTGTVEVGEEFLVETQLHEVGEEVL